MNPTGLMADENVNSEMGKPSSLGENAYPRIRSDVSVPEEVLSADGVTSRSTSAMTSPLSMDIKDQMPGEPNGPKFPLLQHNPPATPAQQRKAGVGAAESDGDEEESSVAKPFERSASPTSAPLRNKGAEYEKVGDRGICKMHKFSLYETATRYYVIGADVMDRRFRVLKIDRTADAGDLSVAEDEIVYSKKEMSQLLNAIDDGNKSTGGMKLKCSTWGLLGFIRFTGAYYMLLITKRSQVAMIGGHYVYQVDGTELVPLTTGPNSRFKPDARNPEESRFLGILNNLDLSRSFYFSYSYDITNTLQHNTMKERHALSLNIPRPQDYNSMFVWNSYLLQPAATVLKNTYDWFRPVIHGYVDQSGRCLLCSKEIHNADKTSALSIYGRTVYITVIARRSRYFAGARFLKRGANDLVLS